MVNWRLADRSVDYLAEDVRVSPVQHFWSLAIEEQFYFLWPLLMLLVAVLGARRWRRGAFILLAGVTVLSFVWAVIQSHSNPAAAFFVSTTRIWELGLGALLALSAAKVVRIPAVLRAAGGWIGLLAIGYSVLFFAGTTVWPGANTLVPTVGAALMIASGIAPTPGSPQRLLSIAPMVWIGGLSYSLYLWHWPMIVGAEAYFGDMRLRYSVAVVLLSLIPAWLCHKYIENPIRFAAPFKPTSRALGFGAALTAMGVGFGFVLSTPIGLGAVTQEASPSESMGARALDSKANVGVVWSAIKSVDRMRPLPTDATNDRPAYYDDQPECQVPDGVAKPELCKFGDPNGQKTIVVVGDSKMGQWQSVLSTIAKRQHWKMVQITKSACTFADVNFQRENKLWTDCRQWGKSSLQEILKMKPDLVIASHGSRHALPAGKVNKSDRTPAALVQGLASYWRAMTEAGIPVVALLDNPTPNTVPVYECVAKHKKDLSRCAFGRSVGDSSSGAPQQRAAAREVPGVEIVDMADTLCPDGARCSAVIGNVLVYRQGSHITRTFADSAESRLSAELFRASSAGFGRKSG